MSDLVQAKSVEFCCAVSAHVASVIVLQLEYTCMAEMLVVRVLIVKGVAAQMELAKVLCENSGAVVKLLQDGFNAALSHWFRVVDTRVQKGAYANCVADAEFRVDPFNLDSSLSQIR